MPVILLVRHVQRLDKRLIPYYGEKNNTPISPCGFIEANITGKKINQIVESANYKWNFVISPLLRTIQTSVQIANCLDNKTDEFNINFQCIGHSDYNEHPESILKLKNIKHPFYNYNKKFIIKNNCLPNTNETLHEMQNRFSQIISDIINTHIISNSNNNLIIVGHRKMFPIFCSLYGDTRNIKKINTCGYIAIDTNTNKIITTSGIFY
jgi:broad specificity phosphatase PhoE